MQEEGDLADIAWFSGNSKGRTQPVGQKRCNAWGLYDMLGNVWEWCADGVRTYEAAPVVDPVGPSKSVQRALRGGSWCHEQLTTCVSRTASRPPATTGTTTSASGVPEFGRELRPAKQAGPVRASRRRSKPGTGGEVFRP